MSFLECSRKKAEERHKELWAFYNETGRLMVADFERITGGKYHSVLATFGTHGLNAPPVYNSRQEKYKRKAKALREEAEGLGQDYLTISQAAGVLRTKQSRVLGIENKLLQAGMVIPRILMDNGQAVETPTKKNEDSLPDNPLYYPSGLQVLRSWPGPRAGQTTYLLR